MNRDKFFQNLFKNFKEAYGGNVANVQKQCCDYWKSLKPKEITIENLQSAVEKKIIELKALADSRKTKEKAQNPSLFACWAAKSTSVNIQKETVTNDEENISIVEEVLSESHVVEDIAAQLESSSSSETANPTPVQDQINSELAVVNERILAYSQSSLIDVHREELDKLKKLRSELKKKLKDLENNQQYQKAFRTRRKREIRQLQDKVIEVCPEFSTTAKSIRRDITGRPAIEVEYPDLSVVILAIINGGHTAAEARRRTDTIRSCLTLDDLHHELKNLGYLLSRQSVYHRLMPRNCNTLEGRRHYKCLPVKLIRAQNSLHSHHEDGHFCSGTNDILKDLAVLFGSQSVFFLSQDDKARIPMGLPAANKQAPLLMNVHYKIALPDHDWTKAPLHKLIPSVYAGCQISDTSVQYVGPTYVAIRSAKHDSSTSITHCVDFEHLLELDQFKQLALDDNEQVKPILIVFVDGGPDENPRFLKTMIAWTYYMQKHNLDAVFVSTYAPGQSAFNPVERRMAPLSHDLSGVILKHDVFGSHLDKNGRTINEELEKKNFKNAGEQLGKIWSETVVGGFPVTAEYISPDNDKPTIERTEEEWIAAHVRQSQYLLQIVRCNDDFCCGPWRTNYNKVIPNRFLPVPLPYIRTMNGLEVVECDKEGAHFGGLTNQLQIQSLAPHTDFKDLPFDLFCPSVRNKNDFDRHVCSKCGWYSARISALNSHRIVHSNHTMQVHDHDLIAEEDIEDEQIRPEGNPDLPMPIINNIFEYFQSQFVEDESNSVN